MSLFVINSNVNEIIFDGKDVQKLIFNGVEVWNKITPIDYSSEYFTFECIEDGSITMNYRYKSTTNGMKQLSYSINGGSWTTKSWNTSTDYRYYSIYGLKAGDKIRMKSTNTSSWYYYNSSSYYYYSYFTFSGKFKVYGNIYSLSKGDNFTTATDSLVLDGMFSQYHYNSSNANTGLVDAKNLIIPSAMAANCYAYMFANCTDLEYGPNIPDKFSTTLYDGCYKYMFYGCSSMIEGPKSLSAATVKASSYSYMFYGCSSLVDVPTAGFIRDIENNGCSFMFYGCSNLENASKFFLQLLGTTGTGACNYMFYNCSKLSTIRCLIHDYVSGVFNNWVYGVAASGTFYKNTWATWPSGVNGTPNGWSVVDG